jgi:hypothetical protein
MEGLAHLVAESLVRHGFETTFDHRSLQWSQWFRCHDSFSLLLAPCKPGLFALGEEVATFCGPSEPGSPRPERSEGSPSDGKRMLALFHISEAHDLGMAMGRLFLSHSPERERLINGRCFARYVVIEDSTQRRSAHDALQRWMASSAEASTGVAQKPRFISRLESQEPSSLSGHDSREAGFVTGHDFSRAANPAMSSSASAAAYPDSTDASEQPKSSNKQAQIGPPLPIPSGF